MKRARRIAGALLALGGAGALADAVLTVVWQEPIGAFQAAGAQRNLDGQFTALTRNVAISAPALGTGYRAAMLRRAHVAGHLNVARARGAALGRLRIPRIGLSDVWVQGTDPSSLSQGPGHYLGTVLPGRRGTVGIAGHRTTHGAPFRHIDSLRPGDPIAVTMPYGTYTYRVTGTQIVSPDNVRVLQPVRTDRLVLTACHPLWSASQRIVVTAQLVSWPQIAERPLTADGGVLRATDVAAAHAKRPRRGFRATPKAVSWIFGPAPLDPPARRG